MSLVVVISGAGGAGKGTVIRYLLKNIPDLWLSVSMTTRSPRRGETNGVDYLFDTPRDEFLRLTEAGEMLETFPVTTGNMYGTPRQPVLSALADGKIALCEVDVNGGLAIKRALEGETEPMVLLVFIKAPSLEVQRQRLVARGDDKDQIEERIQMTGGEEAVALSRYDEIVVNDHLPQTVQKITDLINRHRP